MITAKQALEYSETPNKLDVYETIEKTKKRVESIILKSCRENKVVAIVGEIPSPVYEPLKEWLSVLGYEYEELFDFFAYFPKSLKISWAFSAFGSEEAK